MTTRFLLPLLLAVFCFLLTGCGADQSQSPRAETTNTSSRQDTKAIEAARMMGYDGKQMRQSVDKALNGTEARNKELEEVAK